jgi:thioredoxin reductase (NADPH)
MTVHPVVVIGAGPVGLFQLFELGLQGFTNVPIIDTLDNPGGQCIELYPDKPIYDIPAIPCITGKQLTAQLMAQASPFNPQYLLGHAVKHLVHNEDTDEYIVALENGMALTAKSVIIAAGNGGFVPNRLPEAIEKTLGDRLHYKVTNPDLFINQHLAILGAGDSALDWALNLFPKAATVTLIARSDRFRASHHSVATFRNLVEQEQAALCIGQVVGAEETARGAESPFRLKVAAGGVSRLLETDHVLCFYGLNPKLGPIEKWGLEIYANRLVSKGSDSTYAAIVQHSGGATQKGVWVVGDMGVYANKQRLILSGFHEAANVAVEVFKRTHGEAPTFSYTTTSSIAHQRLGVSPNLDE